MRGELAARCSRRSWRSAQGLGLAQLFVQRRPAGKGHASDEGLAAAVKGAGAFLQKAGEPVFQRIQTVHRIERQLQLLPFHRAEAQEFAVAAPAALAGTGRDQQTAAGACFVDMQALRIAAVGDEALVLPLPALMDVPQRPGVEAAAAQVVQRAGGVAVALGLAFHGAVQDAELEDGLRVVPAEEFGRDCGFRGNRRGLCRGRGPAAARPFPRGGFPHPGRRR